MKENIDVDYYERRYPIAGNTVDGLYVRDDIPNTDSISASSTDYEVLRGIREVYLDDFSEVKNYKDLYYAASDLRWVEKLGEEIKLSEEINPLIVGIDKDGPYVLEGGHRLGALMYLGKKSFPALVFIDWDV